MSFPEWIKVKMDQQQLHGSKLAELIDVKPATISHWLNGRRLPDPESKEKLPSILGCTLTDVLMVVHKAELSKLRERRAK